MSAASPSTVAERLAALVLDVTGRPLPLRLRAWDGSEAGPLGGPVVVVQGRQALRRIIWQPNELGLAQAYISKDIDIEGDLAEVLRGLWHHNLEYGPVRISPAGCLRAVREAASLGLLGPRPGKPRRHARMVGVAHSPNRDRDAIRYHYDQSNEFFELILDERMTYSSGYYASAEADYGLAEAQRDKLDLVCRKLGLRPGMRLLDVGSGWGALAIHAATEYGISVVGITLSAAQHEFAVKRVARLGLSGTVELRLQDYREATDGPYDAITCLEMSEHVGSNRYPGFARQLHDLLAPQGRLLLQHLSRGLNMSSGGPFIATYVSPDLHMRTAAETMALLAAAGLEIRDVHVMREHYTRTLAHWRDNLETSWARAVDLVGEPNARIWRIYLVGVGLTFEMNRMGVEQILAVRPGNGGDSGMPALRC